MTTAQTIKTLIAGLLIYVSFQVGSTGHDVSVAQAQVETCAMMECVAASAFPPSASLFM